MVEQEKGKHQWYSNKELFEMMQELKENLSETNSNIKKYNGLRATLDKNCHRVEQESIRIDKLEKNQTIILQTLKRINWGFGLTGALIITAIVTALLGNIGL